MIANNSNINDAAYAFVSQRNEQSIKREWRVPAESILWTLCLGRFSFINFKCQGFQCEKMISKWRVLHLFQAVNHLLCLLALGTMWSKVMIPFKVLWTSYFNTKRWGFYFTLIQWNSLTHFTYIYSFVGLKKKQSVVAHCLIVDQRRKIL